MALWESLRSTCTWLPPDRCFKRGGRNKVIERVRDFVLVAEWWKNLPSFLWWVPSPFHTSWMGKRFVSGIARKKMIVIARKRLLEPRRRPAHLPKNPCSKAPRTPSSRLQPRLVPFSRGHTTSWLFLEPRLGLYTLRRSRRFSPLHHPEVGLAKLPCVPSFKAAILFSPTKHCCNSQWTSKLALVFVIFASALCQLPNL